MASSNDNELDFSKGSSAFELTRRDPDRRKFRWLVLGIGAFAIALAGLGIWQKDNLKNEGIGEHVVVGDVFVHYTRPVSEAEARSFGQYIRRTNLFRPASKIEILLGKDGNRYVVTLPTSEQNRRDPQVIQGCRELKETLSQDAFGGAPVVIQLCDPYLTGYGTAYIHNVIE